MREAARQRSTGRKVPPRYGSANPFYRKEHSPEQREKWRRDRQGTNSGAANPNYGKFGPEHPSFGHRMSEESRARLSAMRRGELNPNFGKTASAETRAKMSAARVGVPKRSAHTRWHTKRGTYDPSCSYCIEDAARDNPE